MTSDPSHRPGSALRQRMIEDMIVRGFSEKTRSDYIRNVRMFAAFIGRSPGGSSLELKVAGPSMLGIGCPDRHALLLMPFPSAAAERTHPEAAPSRESGFVLVPQSGPCMRSGQGFSRVDNRPSLIPQIRLRCAQRGRFWRQGAPVGFG